MFAQATNSTTVAMAQSSALRFAYWCCSSSRIPTAGSTRMARAARVESSPATIVARSAVTSAWASRSVAPGASRARIAVILHENAKPSQ
jgi:hypothetical protein